eukprot:CAMPEP_0183727736 /NCGR_PEP_ID=MMETSP0737-20130205/26276_1 /TAXON_ID=385413 /ORGANISM="Thalassiosira miniscula, Strain CCMP1093" /LENGTH=870 /DNA_ID=CAMNT_0025959453 /DNA_START=41 /DNA_END=2653 /DNA_ORIENTATION=-
MNEEGIAQCSRKRRRGSISHQHQSCHHDPSAAMSWRVHRARIKMTSITTFFGVLVILGVSRSMALMTAKPFACHDPQHRSVAKTTVASSLTTANVHRGCKAHQHHHYLPHRYGRRSSPFIFALNAVGKGSNSESYSEEEDFDGDLDDAKGNDGEGSDDDDVGAEEYYGRFISEAIKEENEITNGEQSSSGKGRSSSQTSSSPSEDPTTADTTLDETKQMIEQQQQQIDLLMKLVQGNDQQQQQPSLPHDALSSPQLQQSHQQQQQQQQQQSTQGTKQINVAPLKAMLFIDGTWLYYSLNGRNPNRDAILPKFGVGWQNNYKVDWLALPRLICEQIEKQRNSKTSFSGSDRPLEIARVMVFTSAKKGTDPNSIRMRMFRDMANANYDVHMLQTVGQGEKCVDIQLAVEMLHFATVPEAYDVAILLSGDKDFVPALVRTRQKGKQVCVSSMRAGCNRVLYESPHIRDYDVVWLENCLDELIVPIPPEERSRRDRAGYASSFTIMRIIRDFVAASPEHEWISSRDIGKYLKGIDIADSNMLEELKQAHGGLRTFLMERSQLLFEVKFPEAGALRGRGEFSFWVRVQGDSDATLLNEFKRTQFFTEEEKEFLERYKKEEYIEDDSYKNTEMAAHYLDSEDTDDMEESGEDSDHDSFEELASPALDYSQLTVATLKDICRDKGLPVSGKKDVLIERLEEDRKLEWEVIEKQRREAREARDALMKDSTRAAKKPSRPKATRTGTRPPRMSSVADNSIQPGNIYSQALPQMDASRYRNPRASLAPPDPKAAAHLAALIKEYLMASGGQAGSRDIGRYLAANNDSQKGNRSALTELKESYGSLLTFILSREDLFSVLDNNPGYGGDHGFLIELIKQKT